MGFLDKCRDPLPFPGGRAVLMEGNTVFRALSGSRLKDTQNLREEAARPDCFGGASGCRHPRAVTAASIYLEE